MKKLYEDLELEIIRFGAERLSAVNEADYPALMAELEAIE